MAWSAIAWGIGLFGLGTGLVGRHADHAAAAAVASLLGAEPRLVKARLDAGSVLGPLQGKFERLSVKASGFVLESMPTGSDRLTGRTFHVARLDLSLRDFRLGKLDVKGLEASIPAAMFRAMSAGPRLSPVGSGEGVGRVWTDAESVARYAERRFPNLRRLTVAFRGDLVVLEGEAALLWQSADFWLSARPVVTGKRVLGLRPVRVLFGGIRAEGAALQAWTDLLATVIHLDRDLGLNGSMDAEKVIVRPDRIEVLGPVRIPSKDHSGAPSGVF